MADTEAVSGASGSPASESSTTATTAPSGDSFDAGLWDVEDPGTTAFDKQPDDAGGKPLVPPVETPEAPPTQPATAAADGSPAPPASPPAPAAPATPPPTNQQVAEQIAPAPPKFTEQQIQRAAALGWPADALANFQNPEMGLLQAENAVLLNLHAARMQQQPAAGGQQAQQPAQQKPQGPPPVNEEGIRKFWTDQGFDDTIANWHVESAKREHARDTWNTQVYHAYQQLQGQLAHQQQQAQMTIQAHQEAGARQILDTEFDSFKKGLDPVIAAKFTPEEFQQAREHADLACRIMQARGTPPNQMPSIQQFYKQGLFGAFPDKIAAIAREQVRSEVKGHQDLAINRPSAGGKTPRKSPDDEAVDWVNQFWNSNQSAFSNTIPDEV